MYNMLPNSAEFLPRNVPVWGLECDLRQPTTRMMSMFDFSTELMALLRDPDLMQPSNLVMNADSPLSMYIPPDGRLGETLTGTRYKEMYAGLSDPKNQLLCPLIFFTDGTLFTTKSNREMIPVLFTLAIFNVKARQQRKLWRLLGYIPDPGLHMSSRQKSQAGYGKGKGYAVRNFHRCMDVMLSGLKAFQDGDDPRAKGVHLKLMDHWVTVDLKVPILLIIQD